MFWIPNLPKLDLYSKKSSAWAKIQTCLLTAVDENGIVFEIKANEDKPDKVALLDFLASRMRGGVVCLDGAVRSPFLFDSPTGFQLFNVTGVFRGEPQLFGDFDKLDDYKLAVEYLSNKKKVNSYS